MIEITPDVETKEIDQISSKILRLNGTKVRLEAADEMSRGDIALNGALGKPVNRTKLDRVINKALK
tara:strand:+ start:13499 stop:13696 length:198 start_codon:yes stop_codon:yes gene_type:complete